MKMHFGLYDGRHQYYIGGRRQIHELIDVVYAIGILGSVGGFTVVL